MPKQLHTDASNLSLGRILLQDDGYFHPVSYASRQTCREESKYHSTELKTLDVVWAAERFRPYLIGIHFRIVTDCNAVKNTFDKRDLIPRVGRWWLKMLEYNFEISHRMRTRMRHVDALNRNAVEQEETTEVVEGVDILNIDLEDWIILAQRKDSKLQQIIRELTQEREQVNKEQGILRKDYLLREGRLYRRHDGRLLMVIPEKMRWRIVKQEMLLSVVLAKSSGLRV
ncbi:hypothetical protein AMK59_2351 [Oryctes borbonicus]|uniref:Reverse transcriptase RNase H-like domain-containing protein n=1 Tax=Oryctes borbonicus TaxID=1629725 RepID=A0A0T6BCY4_9SCAR|nr:hypothetical protein AMK59_2351 [Oryctes borbonicus]